MGCTVEGISVNRRKPDEGFFSEAALPDKKARINT